MDKKITIVYYGFINPKINWWNIIGGQLSQLKEIGITEDSNIYIHLTGEEVYTHVAISNIKNILPHSVISTSVINQYEYPAIHLLWELAKKFPDQIFLYFHSKGISHGENKRLLHERQLFNSIISSWKKVVDIFNNKNHINKIGLTASELGWMWFNFWWARGTYLRECEEPIITERRHYYEDWLHRKLEGLKPSTPLECYSLADDKEGVHYQPIDACNKLSKVKV